MPSKPNWKGSTGELPPPPVRIVMDSSDMLEEMFRGDTYSLSPTNLSRRASYVAPTIASSRSLCSDKGVGGGSGGRDNGGLLSLAGMGSGGGLSVKSSGSSSKHPSAQALHTPSSQPPAANILLPDHSYLFSNRIRREALQEFVDVIIPSPSSTTEKPFGKSNSLSSKHEDPPPSSGMPNYHCPSTIIESAFTLGRWSIERFNHIIKLIREPLRTRPSIAPNLIYDLDSFHWAALAQRNAEEGAETDQADSEVWKRYAVDILKKPIVGPGSFESSVPDKSNPFSKRVPMRPSTPVNIRDPPAQAPLSQPHQDLAIDMDEIRQGAYDHFRTSILTILDEVSDQELCTAFCFITRYGTAPQMMSIILPTALARISEITLMRDIIPRFVVLAVLQPDVEGCAMVEQLLTMAGEMITIDTANSALEYCAHLQRISCCKLVLDRLGWLVRPEGVASAMLPAAARGSEHILALLELFVMDQMQSWAEKKAVAGPNGTAKGKMATRSMSFGTVVKTAVPKPALWGVGKVLQPIQATEGKGGVGVGGPTPPAGGPNADYGELLAPISYGLLVLAAAAGYAKPSTVKELIEFYEDPCAGILAGRVSESRHRRFVKEVFSLACQLNHIGITWVLIEAHWMPPSVQGALYQAVKLGHQSIVHILLDSLLIADPQIDTHSGVVPRIFCNSEVLALLPMVARRFPTEASWFLEQISCIPIPACVPRTNHNEADLRPRIVRGVRLGSASLLEAIQRFATLASAQSLWSRVSMKGQFHRAGVTATGNGEAECLICMAPAALLDEEAVHDTVGGRVFRSSNPFIRLLATSDESIILQPCMQALMEYHWIRGRFWLRYALQLTLSLTFIIGIYFLFVLIIQKQHSTQLATVASEVYNRHALYPLSGLVVLLSSTFLIQELRQFLDEPSEYVSPSNAADLTIHIACIYAVFRAVFIGGYVPPLLLSAVIVLAACRLLLHLRIIPSVGPIVRIWASATFNILPILIPMMIMALSFSAGFYLVEMSIVDVGNVYIGHFHGMQESLQSVLTMMGGDYSVLDNADHPSVFALRLLFHVIFIIFLVNLIIALLTINVAEIQVNTNAAWLSEIAELMVELELYWPYPMRYKVRSTPLLRSHRSQSGIVGSRRGSGKLGTIEEEESEGGGWWAGPAGSSGDSGNGGGVSWWKKVKGWRIWGKYRRKGLVFPSDVNEKNGPMNHGQTWSTMAGGDDDIQVTLQAESVVLYSCPDDAVSASRWYRTEDGDRVTRKVMSGVDAPRLLRAVEPKSERPVGRWNLLATAFRLGRGPSGLGTSASAATTPGLSGGLAGLMAGATGVQGAVPTGNRPGSASRTLMAQVKKDEEEGVPPPLTSAQSAIGLDLKIVDEVERIIDTEEYSGMSTESSQAIHPSGAGAAALEALQERR
ncbi:hypothetical protein HK097_001594, partial [Rhizophlyctis rosea]